MQDMKKRLASVVLAGSLMGATALGVAAAPPVQTANNGAAGLVAAVVSALNNVNVDVANVDVAVVELNDSLNNLTALNNVLNNSPILSNNEDVVDITVIDGDVTVENVLNDLDLDVSVLNGVNIEDIVAIIQVASGDLVVITR